MLFAEQLAKLLAKLLAKMMAKMFVVSQRGGEGVISFFDHN